MHPTLNVANFKVVQINTHLTNNAIQQFKEYA